MPNYDLGDAGALFGVAGLHSRILASALDPYDARTLTHLWIWVDGVDRELRKCVEKMAGFGTSSDAMLVVGS